MKTNPKQLGNTWEREFCKDLSLWWTKGKDDKVFWRSDSSGAVKGVSELAGDVKAIKEIGYPLIDNVIIELKRTKQKDIFLDLIRRKEHSMIGEWWTKLEIEADQWKREPLLVIKMVNRQSKVCIYSGGMFVNMVSYCLKYNEDIIMLWEDFKAEAEWLNEEK
jgi:hypothetical protein